MSEPFVCPNGYFQDELGKLNCKKCGAGHYCTTKAQLECPIGKFANVGDGYCTTCPEGMRVSKF